MSIFLNHNSKRSVLGELVILVLISMMLMLIGAFISKMIASGMGIDNLGEFAKSLSEGSTQKDRMNLRLILMLNQSFTFLIPSLVFALFLYRSKTLTYLKLNTLQRPLHIPLALMLILFAFPLVQFLYWINQQIPLADFLMSVEKDAGQLTKGMLVMDNLGELILNIVAIALIPAIGEELMFRGVLQTSFSKLAQNPHIGIWFAAFVFSAIHMQFQGFLPRFFLGLLLGYLLYWSGSMWIAIIAHFFNNAFQVVGSYYYNLQDKKIDVTAIPDPQIGLVLMAILIVGFISYRIYQTKVQMSDTSKVSDISSHLIS